MKLSKPIYVEEVANQLQATYKGNPRQEITGLNEIHKVAHGDLTFVDIAKYYNKSLRSAATVILINKEVEVPEGKSIIISDDPFRDYNRLVSFYKPVEKPNFDPNALPSDVASYSDYSDVVMGEDVVIYPGVYIGNHVRIGNNVTLYPNVVIYDDTVIGDNVIIHANTVIGSHAFYYKNRGTHWDKLLSCGRVIIENSVEIGASCSIVKGVSGDTIIGEGCKLDNQIHIGHGVILGKRVLIAAGTDIGGKAIIGNDVMIWGQVGITKDVTIGDNAVLLAQTGVTKSLEGNKAYFGSPATENSSILRQLASLRQLPEMLKEWRKIHPTEKKNEIF